jgi:hypothetical protein
MTLRFAACCASILLIGILGGSLSAPVAWAQAPAPAQVSRIPVTFKTDWPALVALADSAIPKCAGTRPRCQHAEASGNYIVHHEKDWFVVATILGRDIGMKGSVWRFDPLALTLTDGKLNSSLNIFYRTKIGFLARDDATKSCGYNQPANAAMLGVGGKIAFSQDWYVDFTFKPALQADINCGEIFERVDLAKWSAPVIDRAMEAATEKVRTLVRAQTKIRDEAAAVWAKLQEPIALAPGVWLDIRPYAAFANVPELTDNGQYLTFKAGLEARPQVIAGARPRAGTNPLPPLTGTEQGPGFRVDLRAIVEYARMTRVLRQTLVGQTFAAGDSWPARRLRVTVRDVRVQRAGHRVQVSVQVTGFFRGRLHLVGTPAFRNRGNLRGEVIIRDLDYTLETRNLLARLGNRLFQNRIRANLQANAQWDVSSELASAYAQLNQALNSEITPEARLVSSLSQFGPGRISVTNRGVEAGYRVAGQVTVAVNPF